MKIEISSPDEYIKQLPPGRQLPMKKFRKVIEANLPVGFKETMSYGMIGYVVPHTIYPAGYHCNPVLPLPFIHLASQKNYISFYHSALYLDKKIAAWATEEFQKHSSVKLDIGKSCIRFKKLDEIPYDLVGELCTKFTPEHWIELYEKARGV